MMINSAIVDVVKMASSFVVSSGVSTMVGYAAKSSVPKVAPAIIRSRPALVKGFHLFQKVAIPAGAAALAGLASEQAVKYSERKIDENVEAIQMAESLSASFVKSRNDKYEAKKAEESDSTEENTNEGK
jgi:hypothetical protein